MKNVIKGDKFRCSSCGIEVEYNGVGLPPMQHNVDTGEVYLKLCGKFIKI